MSRHDCLVLGLIGMSALASGGLTYLASQRMVDHGFHSAPVPNMIELSVELGSNGAFFFAPLKPSVRKPMRLEQGVVLRAPPLRLKQSESVLGRWGKPRKGSLFRRHSESGPMRWRGNSVYMSNPAANLADRERIHFRR